jgi:hypothetical protein
VQCATSPCRQGTASCGACVEKPNYPRTMRTLAAGNAIPGASAKSGCWIAQEVAARVPPAMAAGMTDSVWTMEALLRSRVPRDLHARLDP